MWLKITSCAQENVGNSPLVRVRPDVPLETSNTVLVTAWRLAIVMTASRVSSRWGLVDLKITGGMPVVRKVGLYLRTILITFEVADIATGDSYYCNCDALGAGDDIKVASSSQRDMLL